MPDEEGLPTAGDVIPGDPGGPKYIFEEGKDIYLTIAKQPVVKLGRKRQSRTSFHTPDIGGGTSQISIQQWEALEGLTSQGIYNFGVLPSGEIRFYRRGSQQGGTPSTAKGNGGAMAFDIGGFLSNTLSPLIKPLIGGLSQKLYGSRAAGTYGGLSKSEYRTSLLPTVFPPTPPGGPGYGPGTKLALPPWLQEVWPGPGGGRYPGGGMRAIDKYQMNGGMMGPPHPRAMGMHWSAKAGKWVRNRRMNVTNSRALSRAMRRVKGFAGFANSCMSFAKKYKMKKGRRKCRS